MTVASVPKTKPARHLADIVERLSRAALTETGLLNDRATRAARGLESLTPVDRIVDRLDRSCDRRTRRETS